MTSIFPVDVARCARRSAMRALLAFGMAFAAPFASSAAQTTPPGTPPVPPQRAGAERAEGRAGQRAQMERQLENRINNIVRTRLGLNDDQFDQLRAVSARMEHERRTLRREEMSTRAELRRHLLAGEAPNESQVAELLERLPRLERRRIDMMEQEQRELARFLQPSQRARYFALQDELRRNLQEGQRRRMGEAGPPEEKAMPRRIRPPLAPRR